MDTDGLGRHAGSLGDLRTREILDQAHDHRLTICIGQLSQRSQCGGSLDIQTRRGAGFRLRLSIPVATPVLPAIEGALP